MRVKWPKRFEDMLILYIYRISGKDSENQGHEFGRI